MNKPNDPWDRENDISILETYDIHTGARETLCVFDSLIEAPNWTKDGEYLIYNSKGCLFRYRLADGCIGEIDTGFAKNINNDHVLSPDGAQIAISHSEEGGMSSRVYALPIGGGTPRLITPNAPSFLHGWSPDGSTLTYCAFRDSAAGGDIYAIPVSGGTETRLTDAPGLNDGPEYSPDGMHIWFNSVRSGLMQVWRMRADGSEQTQITTDANLNSWFPHVSPDGKNVVMISYHKGDLLPGEHLPHKNVLIRLMPINGKTPETLFSLFGGQGTMNVNAWSPDSRRFAYVRYRLRNE